MPIPLDPFRLLLISLAGWLNQQQRDLIDYLQEENRVLREPLGNQRLRLVDQRRRLAIKVKKLCWRVLQELTTLVTLRRSWLGAANLLPGNIGSTQRDTGRPCVQVEIRHLMDRGSRWNGGGSTIHVGLDPKPTSLETPNLNQRPGPLASAPRVRLKETETVSYAKHDS